MKKILSLLLLVPFMAMFTGCDDKDLIFDHERPQFELKDNAILLEVIMPAGSALDDSYYIVGDFNGGEEAAVGNATWKLQKAENSDVKWGIYLVPDTFVNGKTLADGYYFYSVAQGAERSLNNEAVKHVLENAQIGTRTNVWVDRWAKFFEGGGDGEKDYYTIYVDDQSGVDPGISNLYVYNSGVDGSPAWPGWESSGTTTKGGIEFIYFDIDKAYNGVSMNIIFNNNSGWQTAEPEITLDKDLYFRVNSDKSITELDPDDLTEAYQGYTIYINNEIGWDPLYVYAWADWSTDGPVNVGWPGWEPMGTKEINGVTYTYFEPGEDIQSPDMHLIIHSEQDADRVLTDISLDRDYYFKVSTGNVLVEVDPYAVVKVSRTIYVQDLTGWADLALYYYPDNSIYKWPGIEQSGTTTIGGISYTYFEIDEERDGETVNIIFNDNDEKSANKTTDEPAITLNKDFYLTVTTAGIEEKTFKIYVDNQTGYTDPCFYAWANGMNDPVGEWPGMPMDATEIINGVTYNYVEIPAHLTGTSLNLIFNWDSGDAKYEGIYEPINRDYYYTLTPDSATEITNP